LIGAEAAYRVLKGWVTELHQEEGNQPQSGASVSARYTESADSQEKAGALGDREAVRSPPRSAVSSPVLLPCQPPRPTPRTGSVIPGLATTESPTLRSGRFFLPLLSRPPVVLWQPGQTDRERAAEPVPVALIRFSGIISSRFLAWLISCKDGDDMSVTKVYPEVRRCMIQIGIDTPVLIRTTDLAPYAAPARPQCRRCRGCSHPCR
jgi:hypothetical protein